MKSVYRLYPTKPVDIIVNNAFQSMQVVNSNPVFLVFTRESVARASTPALNCLKSTFFILHYNLARSTPAAAPSTSRAPGAASALHRQRAGGNGLHLLAVDVARSAAATAVPVDSTRGIQPDVLRPRRPCPSPCTVRRAACGARMMHRQRGRARPCPARGRNSAPPVCH